MPNQNNIIKKVWGTRERLLETSTVVVDRLTLDSNSFCSWHYHEFKYNMFIILEGEIFIEFEDNAIKLKQNNSYIVEPKCKHRFITEEIPAKIMEIMYTKPVLEDDIIRESQGGKIIDKEYITEDELHQRDSFEKGLNGMREEDYD